MGVFPVWSQAEEIMLEIDIPEVLAELVAIFEGYERP